MCIYIHFSTNDRYSFFFCSFCSFSSLEARRSLNLEAFLVLYICSRRDLKAPSLRPTVSFYLMNQLVSYFFLLLAIWNTASSGALVNVTVEETSPMVVYSNDNSWYKNDTNNPLCHDNSHAYSGNPSATVNLTFKGVAVYFYATQWTRNKSLTLQLDDGEHTTLDLTDDERYDPIASIQMTKSSAIVWSQTDLTESEHTLVVSSARSVGFSMFNNFDAVVYTLLPLPSIAQTDGQYRYIENQTDSTLDDPASMMRNQTADSQSFNLTYFGDSESWPENSSQTLSRNLFQAPLIRYSQNSSEKAVFTFKGVAIYYFSARWPSSTDAVVQLQVDEDDPELIDLTDHASVKQLSPDLSKPTVESSIVWSRTNLSNAEHTLTIGSGGTFAIVDTLMYTSSENNSSNSSNPSTTGTPSGPEPPDSTGPQHGSHFGLIGVVVGGVLGIFALAATIWFLRKRKQDKSKQLKGASGSMGISPFMSRGYNVTTESSSRPYTDLGLFMPSQTPHARGLRRKGGLGSFGVVRNVISRDGTLPPPYEA
ncbi:hypothetical protein D9758_008058 [Tetrapyrgos nigripes]|uniref:Transmembrane protein n=1 Tax=Tetrapyrgos nigripes TaxID=182062 RepID=A0A8H5D0K0_9AGAR|nr:hypothetical protein D9758_008058 [Tetrapyrgos nigripes]